MGALWMAGRRYLFALPAFALFLLAWFLWSKGIVKGNWVLAALFVAMFSFAFALRIIERMCDALQGMMGEEKVAQVLNSLPSQVWLVAHDVPFSGFNVDHLVFSPYGIFVIETKNWAGRVTVKGNQLLVNGRRPIKDPIRQAKTTAIQVAKELEKFLQHRLFVQAVVCFARAKFGKVHSLSGVTITDIDNLLSVFNRKSVTVSNTDLERIKMWLATKRSKKSTSRR